MTFSDSQDHDLDWAQLARYLSGELPLGEARALERWFDQDERSRQLLAEARAAWAASASPPASWADADAGVWRLRQAIAAAGPMSEAIPEAVMTSSSAAEPQTVPEAAPHRRMAPRDRHVPKLVWRERRLVPVALAASLAAFAISGVAVWSLRYRETPELPMPVAMTEVATGRGQRADVRLPDGSRVTLSVASRLRYPRDFGVGARTVELHGAAYFDVVHDKARPFRVRAGAAELEDVGTEFAVRSYGASDVTVVVTEGVVVARRLAAHRDSVVLTASQLAEVGQHGIVRQTDVDVRDYVAWTKGELAFTDATLASIADELSRWFDVDVRVERPAIAGRRFTGRFARRSVDDIVRQIAAAADVTVEHTPDGWRFR